MDPLETSTLVEQAVAAELSYYRQCEHFTATAEDWASWKQEEAQRAVVAELAGKMSKRCQPKLFARHLLERHGYSLHRYMARQLSPAAWACWFEQGGIVVSFHVPIRKSVTGPLSQYQNLVP